MGLCNQFQSLPGEKHEISLVFQPLPDDPSGPRMMQGRARAGARVAPLFSHKSRHFWVERRDSVDFFSTLQMREAIFCIFFVRKDEECTIGAKQSPEVSFLMSESF